jgi:hypothetical protein
MSQGQSAGSLPFTDPLAMAVQIAGVLAECGVQRLTIADPRACRTWDVHARTANLPGTLAEAAPGTTISGEGVALLVDNGCVRWVAERAVASGLREIADRASAIDG